MNRIEPNIQEFKSEKDLGDRMDLILYALNDTVAPIPEAGTICTFKYYAKTPKLKYPTSVDNTYFLASKSGGFVISNTL